MANGTVVGGNQIPMLRHTLQEKNIYIDIYEKTIN